MSDQPEYLVVVKSYSGSEDNPRLHIESIRCNRMDTAERIKEDVQNWDKNIYVTVYRDPPLMGQL